MTRGYPRMQLEKSLLGEETRRIFQAVVVIAIYLSQVTRHDISYAVNLMARVLLPKPSKAHMHMGAAQLYFDT